jgi:hypothetical protein
VERKCGKSARQKPGQEGNEAIFEFCEAIGRWIEKTMPPKARNCSSMEVGKKRTIEEENGFGDGDRRCQTYLFSAQISLKCSVKDGSSDPKWKLRSGG